MYIQITISEGYYLQVKRANGDFVYTSGQIFMLDLEGFIITKKAYKLIGEIQILPPYDLPVKVDERGRFWELQSANWQLVGQVKAVMFINPSALKNLGDNYYAGTSDSGVPIIGNPGEGIFENAKTYYFAEGASNQRFLAVLNIDKIKSIALFIQKMKSIAYKIENKPSLYPDPQPDLATFNKNITALEKAAALASTRVRGGAALRDKAYDQVLDNVHTLQQYVQILADKAMGMQAIIIIENAGFEVKLYGVRIKPDLKALQGEKSGVVKLIAKAAKDSGAYQWQKSDDAINWTDLQTTIISTTILSGLKPASLVYFRFRAILKTGTSNWSQPVSLVIT
ncbi:MAG: hypothetical protein KA792_10635 [Bacteroidales bacterium]|nr:hypothetical protein [Bacteroidales bacterium]